jgi:hypothetical protein
MADIRREVENNYKAFEARLSELLQTKRGKFALMREGNIIEFFDTARDAFAAGQKLYEADRLFSIQEVIEAPIDLGFFSYALP